YFTIDAQTTVSGLVSDDNGETLIGASVLIENTQRGTVTDLDGKFSLAVTDVSSAVLVFSYTGYESQRISLDGRTEVSVILRSETTLDEIVVVGYAEKKKTEVTGAISSLESANFNVGIIASPEQLLQAKIPGVRVTSSSGEPGAAIDVSIRGAGSLRSGNSPLYVIDGVALSNDAITPGSANVVGSNAGNVAAAKNPLNFLNPDDIESIDVLKDASATAIYGSRGSNGVILITTKKGKPGAAKVSYNGYVGTASLANKIDLVGSGSGTDWQDEITRSALSQNHNLSYSGGSDRASYRASLSLLDQEGIIDKSRLRRYTGRLNSRVFALPDNRLRIDMNLIGSHVIDNGIPRSDVADTDGELITNTLSADPGRPIRDANGDFSAGPTNPVGFLDAWNDATRTDRLLANIAASLTIVDGLKYQVNFGVDRSNATREQELSPNNLEGININNGSYNFATIAATNALVENFVTYRRVVQKNNFDFLLGHAYQEFEFNTFNIASSNFLVPSISASDDPGNATTIVGTTTGTNPDGTREINKLESVFARVNYSFDDTYMLTASIRADGSSKFGSNNRWGYFPAVAAAWRISKSMNLDVLDDLRLRVGWGQTGNQEIPNKATQETFQVTQNGVSRVREANPDLKWEVSTQFNVGVDFALADSKLYGSLDFFNKVNTDPLLLVDSEPPAISQKWINLPGEITNSGLEIFLGSQLINTKSVSWSVDVNGTFTSNSVSFPDGREIFTGILSGRSINGTLTQVIRDGESLGTFFLPVDNGDATSTEREVLGSGIPDFVYGINNYLRYKDLDLSFNLSGVTGNQIYNATDNFLSNFGGNVSQRIADADGVIPPGASSFFLEEGAFLRLNNLTIGYNLPLGENNWLSRARLYVTGQNLFVLTEYTGYDPEVNTPLAFGGNLSYGIDFAAYPRARTFLFGVNIDFK
ncbi:MAG: SusC/RagA family TonB-linked outer membrane protein, partial [Bacteroidota bacterium]